jgi:dihydrofolate synthase/folylpolyglutamate synthase
VVVDGAHNADAAALLAATLDEEFSVIGSRIAVVGMLEGRDPSDLLEALAPARFDLVIATRPDTPRGAVPEKVASAAARAGLPTEIVADPVEAVERTLAGAGEEDLVVVCGSFYLVGPAREQLIALLSD